MKPKGKLMPSINLDGREVRYELVRRPVKYLRIYVIPEGYLRIVSPTEDVEEFIRNNKSLILEKLAVFEEIPQETFEKFPLFGRFYDVEKSSKTGIRGNMLCYQSYPRFELFLRRILRKEISSIIARYSPLIGRTPNRVFIRKSRGRWGSCSSKGNLSFSLMAVSLPEKLLEYLVLHELTHLIEMNHSRAFWDIMSRFHPDYREERRELRRWWVIVRNSPFWKRIMEGGTVRIS